MGTRKKWSSTWMGDTRYGRKSHPSQRAAYNWIRVQANLYAQRVILPSYTINVYVDEGDGQGWQLYESIKLADIIPAT